jgi:hypothetical protein
MRVMQAPYGLSLGEAQVVAGHLEEAQALAELALAHAREHQERDNKAYALRPSARAQRGVTPQN